VLPQRLARGGDQAFDHVIVIDTMKHNELAARDRRAGIALAYLVLPDDRRTLLRKGVDEVLLGRRCVAVGSEQLRPVAGDTSQGQHHER
jgi:hypothetical protein